MKRFSRLSAVISALIDMIWAGMLWLLCSLPVITLGASTTALYYAVVKCVRHDRGRLTPSFFRSFRSNFRQATLLWLICLAYLAVGLGDIIALKQMGVQPGSFLYYFSRLFLLPVPLLFPWLFAFLSRFQNSIQGTLRYTVYLALRHFGVTLLLAFELALFGLICWLIPFLLPLLPGAFCLLMSLLIEPVFRPLTESASAGREDDWYNE